MSNLVRSAFLVACCAASAFAHGDHASGVGLIPPENTIRRAGNTLTIGPEEAYKSALHVHSSFSEGSASMQSNAEAYTMMGFDILYFTDHDTEMTAPEYGGMYNAWGLDSINDARIQVPLFMNQGFTGASVSASTTYVAEGTGSIRVEGTGPQAQSLLLYSIQPKNTSQFRRSIASGINLHMSVYPETVGANASPAILVRLSYHACPEIGGNKWLTLRYILDNTGAPPSRNGPDYTVHLSYTPGQWNDVVLPVTDDAIAGFPFLDGEDNGLNLVACGINASQGAHGVAYFDNLWIEQQMTDQTLFDKQREIMERLQLEYPNLTLFLSTEHSAAGTPHLIEYGPDMAFPDFSQYYDIAPWFIGTRHDWVIWVIVNVAHAAQHTVNHAHPFGTGIDPTPNTLTKEQLLANMLVNRAHETDLMEVGYPQRERPADDTLWVWDHMAQDGLYLTGMDVSDNHGGDIAPMLTYSLRGATWIYSPTLDERDIADYLDAGRAFFGDGLVFTDERLDLTADNGARMGNVIVTDRPSVDVELSATGLLAGDRIVIVENGVAVETINNPPVGSWDATRTLSVDPVTGSLIRFEIQRDTDRTNRLWSNPIYAVPHVIAEPIKSGRLFIDMLGVRSIQSYALRASSITSSDNAPSLPDSLDVGVEADDGTLVLDVTNRPERIGVTIDPALTGNVTLVRNELRITGLTGTGALHVAFDPNACLADFSGDAQVDVEDFGVFAAHFGEGPDAPYEHGDLNRDGTVNVMDFGVFATQFGCD